MELVVWVQSQSCQGRQNISVPGSIKGLQRRATRQISCHYFYCPQSKSWGWGAMSAEGCIHIMLLSPLGLLRTDKAALPWVWASAMAWDQEIRNGNRMQQFTSIRCLAFTLYLTAVLHKCHGKKDINLKMNLIHKPNRSERSSFCHYQKKIKFCGSLIWVEWKKKGAS